MWMLVALGLILIAAAGCSGGDDESSTETEGAAPATATTEQPATAKADPAALRRYLAQLQPQVKTYDELREAGNSALDGVNRDHPDESWDRAARELRQVRDSYDEITSDLDGVEPPAGLAGAHDALQESLSVFSLIASTLAADLAGYDTQAVSGWTAEISPLSAQARALREEWRRTTIAAVRRAGIELPPWLEALAAEDVEA